LYEGSGVGTDGKGLSTRVYGGGVDMEDMMDEWLGHPSVGRRPDLCGRESTGKRVRVRQEYEAKR